MVTEVWRRGLPFRPEAQTERVDLVHDGELFGNLSECVSTRTDDLRLRINIRRLSWSFHWTTN